MKEEIKKQVQAEQIHLQSIKVISGNMSTNPDIDVSSIKIFNTDFDVETGLNLDNEAVRIIFKASLVGVDEYDTPVDVKAEYTIEFIFVIEDLKCFIVDKNDEVMQLIMEESLATTLMSIVYSTTRGIILTKTQGTIMEGVIIPVINPLNLLTSKSENNS